MRFLPPKFESQALPWLRVSGLCPWTSAIPGPRDNTSTLGHHRLPDITLKPTFPSNSCFCLQQFRSSGFSGQKNLGLCSTRATGSHATLTHQINPESNRSSHLHWPGVPQVPSSATWAAAVPAPCTRPPLPCVIFPPSKRWQYFKHPNLEHVHSLFESSHGSRRNSSLPFLSRAHVSKLFRKHLGSASPQLLHVRGPPYGTSFYTSLPGLPEGGLSHVHAPLACTPGPRTNREGDKTSR